MGPGSGLVGAVWKVGCGNKLITKSHLKSAVYSRTLGQLSQGRHGIGPGIRRDVGNHDV